MEIRVESLDNESEIRKQWLDKFESQQDASCKSHQIIENDGVDLPEFNSSIEFNYHLENRGAK